MVEGVGMAEYYLEGVDCKMLELKSQSYKELEGEDWHNPVVFAKQSDRSSLQLLPVVYQSHSVLRTKL